MLAWFWTFIQFYQYTLLTVVVLPNQHSEWIIRWVSQSSAFTCMWHTLCLSPILCGTWMNRMKYWIAVAECYSEKKSSSEMLSVGEMVSPGWFTSHVVCLSDCSIADSVRGTSEEAQGGLSAKRSTRKTCYQWHTVWPWANAGCVFTMRSKGIFKINCLNICSKLHRSKFICTQAPVLLNQKFEPYKSNAVQYF